VLTTVSEKADLPLIITHIKKLILSGVKSESLNSLVSDCSRANDPAKCLFDLVYSRVVYMPDPENVQRLKTVDRILKDGRGNCAHYVTLLGAALLKMGIPYKIRIASYTDPTSFEHVYIVLDDGRVLDPVLGQDQTGTGLRNIVGLFNEEKKTAHKKDYLMTKLEILQGLSGGRIRGRSNAVRLSGVNPLGCCLGAMNCGNNCTSQLQGKFWDAIKDAGQFIGNTVVSPIEGVIGAQIINPKYSGGFWCKAEGVTSSLLNIAAPIASTAAAGIPIPINVPQNTNCQAGEGAASGSGLSAWQVPYVQQLEAGNFRALSYQVPPSNDILKAGQVNRDNAFKIQLLDYAGKKPGDYGFAGYPKSFPILPVVLVGGGLALYVLLK
jgi:hypothetical protein